MVGSFFFSVLDKSPVGERREGVAVSPAVCGQVAIPYRGNISHYTRPTGLLNSLVPHRNLLVHLTSIRLLFNQGPTCHAQHNTLLPTKWVRNGHSLSGPGRGKNQGCRMGDISYAVGLARGRTRV